MAEQEAACLFVAGVFIGLPLAAMAFVAVVSAIWPTADELWCSEEDRTVLDARDNGWGEPR